MKLGQNHWIMSETNGLFWDSCGGFAYLFDIGIYHKMDVTLTIVKQKFEVLNLFPVALDVLFMVLFLKKNLFHFTLFCVKLPHFNKININPLFFVPHEFPATHFHPSFIPEHQIRKNKFTCSTWKIVVR